MNTVHYFELYILADNITPAHWELLYGAVKKHIDLFGSIDLTFRCTDNVVRFFVSSPKDLSVLSNGIEDFVLKRVEPHELQAPHATRRESLVQLPASGNVLDMRERYAIKKNKTLAYVVLKIRTLGLVKASLYFQASDGLWSTTSKYLKRPPLHLFAINFTANTKYLKNERPPIWISKNL
ncbi:MAG TPA: hypothetical protein VGO07_02250 [Candidatus Saccharimonadales bacterium]|jgi:hypothetical protein|nr:hypothetical protein [Candidatus Saccharimonadales bacterium]